MKPIFAGTQRSEARSAAGSEEARVLHATRELITPGLAKPILIGRPSVIEMRSRNPKADQSGR